MKKAEFAVSLPAISMTALSLFLSVVPLLFRAVIIEWFLIDLLKSPYREN